MKLLKRITITCGLLLLTSTVAGGWNKVDHPFDGLLMYTGDKVNRIHLGDTEMLAFWVRLNIYKDHKMKQSLHHLMVNCYDPSFIQMYIESDTIEEPFNLKTRKVGRSDMMYYPIEKKCGEYLESIGEMCYPEPEEDLTRTNADELSDMLMEELGGGS